MNRDPSPQSDNSPTEAESSDRRITHRFRGFHEVKVFPIDEVSVEAMDEALASGAIKAWTQNVSEDGICFRCLQKIDHTTLIVQSAEFPTNVAQVEVVWRKEALNGLWEYGTMLQKILS